MNERRTGNDMGASTDSIAVWLGAARGPAFVISPADASVVAANLAGAQMLGFATGFDGPEALDSAMPAVMALRRTAAGGQGVRRDPMQLVFWTAEGVARLTCRVVIRDMDDAKRYALIEVEGPLPCKPARNGREQQRSPQAQTEVEPPQPDLFSADLMGADRQNAASVAPERPQEAGNPHRASQHTPNVAEPRSRKLPPYRAPPPAQMPATAAAAEPVRSDEETLKAIAKQILSGRRGRASTQHSPAKPAGEAAAPQQTRESPAKPAERAATEALQKQSAAMAKPSTGRAKAPLTPGLKGGTNSGPADRAQPLAAAPATVPATARHTARDVRRSEVAGRRSQAASRDEAMPIPVSHAERLTDKGVASPPADSAGADPPGDVTAERDPAKQDAVGDSTARRTMVRRLAHELKTPISAIVSAAEIMKDERFGPIGDQRYLRYARDIHESARHALAVVERMLGQRQLQRESLELSFTNLDLNQVATSILSSMDLMARDAGLELQRLLAPRLPLVVADATSVRQIVLNLVTNALKFTPRGGRVSLSTAAEPNGPLTLTVSDTGRGMSEEDIAQVMEDAYEDAPQVPRPGGGFGIGLPLARALAAANGATISIAANEAGGTSFTLSFPVSRQVPV